jgi:predicted phage terminase large subunit-like protein
MTWNLKHQKLIYKYLAAVTSGDCKRLMIFLPPRHGKSELVTARYTAWRMKQDPTLNVILGSYNQRLASRFSRKVRRVISEAETITNEELRITNSKDVIIAEGTFTAETQRHGEDETGYKQKATIRMRKGAIDQIACGVPNGFSPRLRVSAVNNASLPFTSRRANSVDEWETIEGGGLRAVGVGSGVTGFGANLIIIDDPVKNRAEAESETYRENVWDWFNDDIYTRLEPNGSIILIQTRWHEDDLAGRLIKEMAEGGEYWDILALPAIAEGWTEKGRKGDEEKGSENPDSSTSPLLPVSSSPFPDLLGRAPGEALCPQRYDIAALEKLRRKLGSYSFSALYQQRPTPLDGGLFKRKWFSKVVEQVPQDVKLVRTYDLAVSTRTTADFTASALAGFDPRGNFYIADVMRKRLEYPEQRQFILDCLRREPNVPHGVELALHGQAIIQDLRRYSPTRASALIGIKVETDKVTRALAWASLAEEGKVILVRGPWLHDFIEEVCTLPNCKHDDQIDAVSMAIKITTKRQFRTIGF